MNNNKDKGFTLVELLIVIVVLGILATVTVLAVSGITDNAKENSCKSDGATILTAYEAAYVELDATVPAFGDINDKLGANSATSVAAAPADGVWGYTAPAAGAPGELTPPLDAPTGCDPVILS
jgi:prepilin-type N-terminal cleavage/methylation domain-containing protein